MKCRDVGEDSSTFVDGSCGQNALQLVAKGNTIIAELLRLSEHIPEEFEHPERTPYADLISDYSYFKQKETFEKRISSSDELTRRDEEFCATHGDLLDRFFKLFRGVLGYATELNRFMDDVQDGVYLSQTLESILLQLDGKQLLCELWHLYGAMLLLLDYRLGGRTREYLVVSYIRYRGSGEPQVVDITNLCRATGFSRSLPPPDEYPVAFFKRIPMNRAAVPLLLAQLRSDDVYSMSSTIPAPGHRSAALALQGALVYVLLFFTPETLRHESYVMQEIVGKHFHDTWVISYYMGFTTDLVLAWRSFPAAKAAIANVISLASVTHHQRLMHEMLRTSLERLSELEQDGVLTEEYALNNVYNSLLPCLRDANVALRWFTLHSTRGRLTYPSCNEFADSYAAVVNGVDDGDILALLSSTAQMELSLRTMFLRLLRKKHRRWEKTRAAGGAKMRKLSDFYSGNSSLTECVRDVQLQEWFLEMANRIDSLTYSDVPVVTRRLQKLIRALESVETFHQVDSNLQALQFVRETRHLLHQMVQYTHIDAKVLMAVDTIGDFSYAWECMAVHGFLVTKMQNMLQRNPESTMLMRSVFAKLASILEIPCKRIDQGAKRDSRLVSALASTSEFYSSDLVAFVRRVLHIIPVSIFSLLRQVMHVLRTEWKECPGTVTRQEAKELLAADTQCKLAAITADMARYARGVLAMQKTFVGVVEVNPHQLLEDGIRSELLQQLNLEFERALQFDSSCRLLTLENWEAELRRLDDALMGAKRALEYAQDVLNVQGGSIWGEELRRLVCFNVDMECNSFMQKKLYPWRSIYQSDSVPIPYTEHRDISKPYGILGRLVHQLLSMTDPKSAVYLPSLSGWYSLEHDVECVGIRSFVLLRQALGPAGLQGLHRLLGFISARDVQLVVSAIRASLAPVRDVVEEVWLHLRPWNSAPPSIRDDYDQLVHVLGGRFSEVTELLVRLGRVQLMHKFIAKELQFLCRTHGGPIFGALASANDAVLHGVRSHFLGPSKQDMPDDILTRVAPFLDSTGMSDALSVVYMRPEPLPHAFLYILALIQHCAELLRYDSDVGFCLPGKPGILVDSTALMAGVAVVLKQLHSDQTRLLFQHFTQVLRAHVRRTVSSDGTGALTAPLGTLGKHSKPLACMARTLAVFTNTSLPDFYMLYPAIIAS